MANPMPRQEAKMDVHQRAIKTGWRYRVEEREGENGEWIVYAVKIFDGEPLLGEDGKPIESAYRPLSTSPSHT